MERLKWCFRQKDGIRIKKPSEEISDSFLSLAKTSLKGAEVMLKEKDLVWATVMIYYAEYYALYSFLTRIGIKCENHYCSILLCKHLLGQDKVSTIEQHRKRRLDAQYYLSVIPEKEIERMLKEAKFSVADFEGLINDLTDDKIESHRQLVKSVR
jgi:uncharacterized protein (UPF0332 family)